MMKPTRSWMTGLGLKTLATLLLSTLLVSCGSSKKYDEFIPTRILSIGDAFSYVNTTTSPPVNTLTSIAPDTGTTDHWLWTFAASYGLSSIGAAPGAGKNVVFFNASTTTPTSGGLRSTLGTYSGVESQANTLKAQITPQAGDLVVITMGMGDVFARADTLGGTTTTDTDSTATAIGLQYVNLADSLYQHGFKHVLIVNAVDYSPTQYVLAQPAAFRTNIANLTAAINRGVNQNCNGGCVAGDNKPWPSGEGVRKYDLYNLLRRIVDRSSNGFQPNGSWLANINNGTYASVYGAVDNPLCLHPSLLSGCTPSSLNDANSLPYYFSGDLWMSPLTHRYIGTVLYNFSRSTAFF